MYRFCAVLAVGTFISTIRAEDPTPPAVAARFQIDKDRRIFAGIRDDERVLSEAENLDEFLSYNEVFEFAHQFAAADLETHARRDITYRDLMGRNRDEFKLDLIVLEGRLWRVSKRNPTPTLEAAGVSAVYEGWLFPRGESEPVCILFSQLPAEITPATELRPAPSVRFAGYAFKVIRYEGSDRDSEHPAGGRMRRAPMLIGKSVTVLATPTFVPGSDWQGTFVPALLTGIGVLSAIGFGLAWWFRRGDRLVRSAVAGRAQQNPFSAV